MRTTSSGTSAAISSQRPSHRHAVQLQRELLQPVQRQDRQVGAGGAVEADAPRAPPASPRGHRRLIRRRWRRTRRHARRNARASRPPRRMPSAICGRHTCSRYRREHSGCSRTPSPTWPATRSIASPTAAMVTGDHRQPGRLGREIRRHQRQCVVRRCGSRACPRVSQQRQIARSARRSRACAAPARSRECRSAARCGPSPGCRGPARSGRRNWPAGPRPGWPARSGCAETPPRPRASVPRARVASAAKASGVNTSWPSSTVITASNPASSAARAAGPAARQSAAPAVR